MNNESQIQNSNAPSTSTMASDIRQEGATQDPSLDEKQFSTSEPKEVDRGTKPSSQKSTGPRTPQGKKRSKFNARKYGFFSKTVLWEGESRKEYDALLYGLREDFQPQRKLENIEVEYLATLYWQRRRYFEIERAEMFKRDWIEIESFLTLLVQRLNYGQRGDAKDEKAVASNNLRVVRNAIDALTCLRGLLMAERSENGKELRFHRRLLGLDDEGVFPDSIARLFLEVQKLTEQFKTGDGEAADSEEPNKVMCKAIDAEIEHLAKLHNEILMMESQKIESEGSELSLLPQKVLDPLLRCQSHVSREIERTLGQLERLQRMRKGQSMPPRLDVNIS
jgi:hypothetical protein